jgi:hypothetical protein
MPCTLVIRPVHDSEVHDKVSDLTIELVWVDVSLVWPYQLIKGITAT